MDTLDITDLLRKYDEGDLTTKELLGRAFSYLNSHRDDIFLVLAPLREHPEKAIQELREKLLTLLEVAQTTQARSERFG